MNFSWSIFIDLGLICIALLIATYIRSKVRFFQKFLIPNALVAGFVLLPFYNYAAPRLGMSSEGLENLVFHLLNLSFVAMSLRGMGMKGAGRRIFSSSVIIIIQYTLQVIIGFGLTLVFIYTFLPKLFPSFGFLMPLGFGLGPGQAFAIGKTWEALGFEGGGNLGLVFAAIGYLWACFLGIALITIGRRRGWMDPQLAAIIEQRRLRTGILPLKESKPVGSLLTTETEAIDTLSFNLALVLGVYLLAYLFLQLLTFLLSFAGSMGTQLAGNLWGIAFIFAAIIAMFVKRIFRAFNIDHSVDNGTLTRLAGGCIDIMVTAAIAAITVVVLTRFWIPILAIAVVGGVVSTITIFWTVSRLFTDNRFARAIMFYGNLTGTLSTGLALLRVVDPDFKTPVATDYMYGTGVTFVLVIPLILMLNLPGYWYSTGRIFYLWVTLAIIAAYLVFSFIAYSLLAGKRGYRKAGSLWLSQ
ncbi:MAG: sodium:glutamate symporter [Spirochaetaceae bacterium]|nr:MAG: sodium:glutamate symporter [Spirochaetaceae bacterium]